MFLKSIEIRGFKSFADKTEILFKNGVTSIVGPNGSGKSNISDAVKWVLGEQSIKNLRGGKMEDVIFAGTQFRKPVGLCQVSLTLDNIDKRLSLDYTDVTISRRLYRSGESEYYINNTQCRLKDIQELFMDTGIGKEGYSIIGQGKIEAVLNGRPEERRSLLEEAAGIVKFKWRKEEAEKRLQNTEVNLVRIDDILGSHEERLEPLLIENEKAKKFIKLSEELKSKEISVAAYSLKKIQDKIDNVEETIRSLNSNSKILNSRLDDFKLKIQQWNKKLEDGNIGVSDYKKQYYDSKSKKQDIESETRLLNERLENLKKLISKNLSGFSEIKDKLDLAISNKNTNNSKLSILKDEQLQLSERIYEYEINVEATIASISDKSDLIKKLKNDQIEFLSNISNLKNYILMLNNNIEALKEKVDSIKSSCNSYLHSMKINSVTKQMFLKQIEDLKIKISNWENKIKTNKQEIYKNDTNLSKSQKELKELTNIQSKLEANYTMLTNLEKQYDGYNRSVKALMKEIENGKTSIEENSCFVLGDIIDVEKRLETSIEIALGGAISDIITKDEGIAKKLIIYLKENNLGRATFLPLTIVKGKKLSYVNNISKIKGYIGIASELIKYDQTFVNAIEYVLGRTIICEDMDSALNIAKISNYSFKIVTILGEVINPGGSLTGGSLYNRVASIVGRKREIEETKFKIKNNEENLNGLNSQIKKYSYNIKVLDEENLNLRDKIYSENIEITKIKGKINTIDNESGKLKENLNISKAETEDIDKKIKENIQELTEKQEELQKKSQQQVNNNNLIIEVEDNLKDKDRQINEVRKELTELKIKKAKVDEIISSKVAILKNVDVEIEELSFKSTNIKEENKKSEIDIIKCNDEILKNKEIVGNIGYYILNLEEKIKEQDVKVIKIKEQININSSGMEDLKLIIGKNEEELHKMQISLTKAITEKEALCMKLKDDLEINYEDMLQYEVDIENADVYRKEILTLKSSISSLGVINLGAIDEYKELTGKVNFMTAQREDLIKSKEELSNIINEMTEKIKILFNENFSKMRENFNETFKELFKGGSADLILSDGDELTANIDITVQPPGKKLQNINLMSGGEKGLSAIALLFAILKMKPTPFCILDEIEAALDDVNVVRYSEFLKKFSQNVQFIVITHRKGTMEASDALYGVTMEEKGVSKVISVDLNRQIS
jgi:chromosome segregation protein